jgi:predicted ATPase
VRLGLGYDVETISLRAGSSGGTHSLWLKMQGQDELISASSISDGMLAYLAFVALYRLPRPDRSLLVFDEPDLHLHPELLGRVVGYFERIAEDCPVLLTTHSDRLLDGLSNPAQSVRVCQLEQPGAKTQLSTLDAEGLASWLEKYRGLGDLRSAGHLRQIIAEPSEEAS